MRVKDLKTSPKCRGIVLAQMQRLMGEVCRSETKENRAWCWVDDSCPQFAEGKQALNVGALCLHKCNNSCPQFAEGDR